MTLDDEKSSCFTPFAGCYTAYLAIFYGIWFHLIVSINGCATLPDFRQALSRSEACPSESPAILSPDGLLSTEESLHLISKLNLSIKSVGVLKKHISFMDSISRNPLVVGNKVVLLSDRRNIYASMLQAIARARDHINIEVFTLKNDELGVRLANALLEKKDEGVDVNLIYDSIGSWGTPSTFFYMLKSRGIQVLEFNPLDPLKRHGFWKPMHRDHRKILIVDGKVAVVGSANIGLAHLENTRDGLAAVPFRDTAVMIEGPAVAELQNLFFETWRKQCGPILHSKSYFPVLSNEGDDLVRIVGSAAGVQNRTTYLMYLSMLRFAEHSIHLANAYFAPDRAIVETLCEASRRGVDVRVVLPGISDHQMVERAGKFYYTRLLRSGVKLYEYRSSFLHAKTAVVDGVWSTVGSTNMDMWSASRNDEVNVVILSRKFAKEMEFMFAKDLEKSQPIVLEEWERRALGSRLGEWFSHLFTPWL